MKTQWISVKLLLSFYTIAFLLALSWYMPGLNHFWLVLDEQLFLMLNGALRFGHGWQVFWSFLNLRIGDLISLLVLLVATAIPGVAFTKPTYRRLFIRLIALIVFVYLVKVVFLKLLGTDRISPSLVYPTPYVIPLMVPEFTHVRFFSGNCFPSDHGCVIFTWMLFMLCYARPRFKLPAILLAILLTLPRLVIGAHWFSDEWVGGMIVALICTATFCLITEFFAAKPDVAK